VMTAAHCCVDNSPDVVQISDKNLNSPIFFTENSNRIKIQEVINHPNYVVSTSYNDISLIRLAKNVV
jgi:secreted trypsin-like serine protease